MTPHKCPICNGNGIIDAGFYNQTSGYWTSTEGIEACRACNGTGIVWEKIDYSISDPLDADPYWGLSGIGE